MVANGGPAVMSFEKSEPHSGAPSESGSENDRVEPVVNGNTFDEIAGKKPPPTITETILDVIMFLLVCAGYILKVSSIICNLMMLYGHY